MWIDVGQGWGIGGGIFGDWEWVVWAKIRTGITSFFLYLLTAIIFCIALGLLWGFVPFVVQNYKIGLYQPFSKELLTPLIAVLVGSIALLAFFRDRSKILLERRDTEAKIRFDQSKKLLDRSYDVLKERTNKREEWIYAARLLMQAMKIGESIDHNSDHYTTYILEKENLKRKLRKKLCQDNGDALPIAFFFGCEDWLTNNLSVDDLFKETSYEGELHAIPLDGRKPVPNPNMKNLDEHSVVCIMGFLENQLENDELQNVNLNSYKEWKDYSGLSQCAKRYLDKKMSRFNNKQKKEKKSVKKFFENFKEKLTRDFLVKIIGYCLLVITPILLLLFVMSLFSGLLFGFNLSGFLIQPLITSLVASIAWLAFFRDKEKIEAEKIENSSKILYEQSKEAMEHAYETLKLLPQDRVEWIYAATSIIQSDLIGKKICSENYKLSYNALRNKYQQKFIKIITRNGNGLPTAFFFGDEDWMNESLDLRDVKERTLNPLQITVPSIYNNHIIPSYIIKNFEIETIVVIMSFLNNKNYFKSEEQTDENLEKQHKDHTETIENKTFEYQIKENDFLKMVDKQIYLNWDEYDGLTYGAKKYICMMENDIKRAEAGGCDVTVYPGGDTESKKLNLPPKDLPLQARHLVND